MLMMIVPVHYQDLEPAQKYVARTNSWVFDHRTDLVIECSRHLNRNGGNWKARIPGNPVGMEVVRVFTGRKQNARCLQNEDRRILHVMLLFLYLQR